MRPGAILTVTPNAALDRTWLVRGDEPRPLRTLVRAGGKGVNVARAWTALGGKACAAGLAGGESGRRLRRGLAEEGIEDGFVAAAGETRTCAVVIDADGGQREIYEPGAATDAATLDRLLARLRRLLAGGRFAWLACSGSLPPGMPGDCYARCVELARAAGVPTAVDAAGPALVAALAARPALVKANADEVGAALGRSVGDQRAAIAACRALRARGAEAAVVTLGGDGAVGADQGGAWTVAAPRVRLLSAVGSGDCFLAGLIAGLPDLAEALRWAAAAGADNARRFGAGVIDPEAVRRLAARVRVTAVPAAGAAARA